ncbi:uncharacterized protein RHO25_002254 [Cercospora beticola]|uniref:Uncharacterized protein n=1 Tax=Cercospora beticola TaxID=122368 RepID=A0ABZ0NDR0_CERBT|nr:hypothetical protein RHO25_002254 [Cercospora beticola]
MEDSITTVPCMAAAVNKNRSIPTSVGSPAAIIRRRELRLMHHWSRSTCDSFSREISNPVKDHIIEIALQHEYLLEAVFALTAAQIASSPERSDIVHEYTDVARDYQHRAVGGLRRAIDTLSPATCDAIFISSTILLICTIVSPFLGDDHHQSFQATMDAMLELSSFLHGLTSVLAVSRDWIIQGPMASTLDADCPIASKPFQLPFMEDLRHANTEKDGETRAVLAHAMDMLETSVQGIRFIIPWVIRIRPKFFQLLREGDDLALVIFMQWGVLLDRMRGMWWAEFSARGLVEQVSKLILVHNDKWAYVADWSRSRVGLCSQEFQANEQASLTG